MSEVEVEVETATQTTDVVDVSMWASGTPQAAVLASLGGRYEILRELGRGAFGVTYLGVRHSDGLEVAIKSMDLSDVADWKSVELFEREARVLAGLSHRGVPSYIEHVAPSSAAAAPGADARFVLVQERAPGMSLRDKLAAGWRPTEAEASAIGEQLVGICGHLHKLTPPVVHRDIKPANVIVDAELNVSLVDFGAVKERIASETTVESTVVGTYGYMAPEQFQGRSQAASDLYGIGATLVRLVTGVAPADLPQKRLKLDWRGRANVSDDFAAWIDGLIAPAPEDRSSAPPKPAAPPPPAAMQGPKVEPLRGRVRATRQGDELRISLPLPFASVAITGAMGLIAVTTAAPILFPLAFFALLFGSATGGRWVNRVWRSLARRFGRETIVLTPTEFRITRRGWFGNKTIYGGLHRLTVDDRKRKREGMTTYVVTTKKRKRQKFVAELSPQEARWVDQLIADYKTEQLRLNPPK